MIATDILIEEHRIIMCVLHCLETVIKEAQENENVDSETVSDMISFFRGFADDCHHSKEEDQLFPALEANGFPRDSGPVAVMASEHDQGRALLTKMNEALPLAADGDDEARSEFIRNADLFRRLLSDHIAKEDHCLFPMSVNAIAPAKHQHLLDAFHDVEQNAGGQRHARYIAQARALCTQHGVPFVTDSEIETIQREFLSSATPVSSS